MLKVSDDKESSTYYGNVLLLLFSSHFYQHRFLAFISYLLYSDSPYCCGTNHSRTGSVKQQPLYYAHRFRDGWLISVPLCLGFQFEDLERLAGGCEHLGQKSHILDFSSFPYPPPWRYGQKLGSAGTLSQSATWASSMAVSVCLDFFGEGSVSQHTRQKLPAFSEITYNHFCHFLVVKAISTPRFKQKGHGPYLFFYFY